MVPAKTVFYILMPHWQLIAFVVVGLVAMVVGVRQGRKERREANKTTRAYLFWPQHRGKK